MLTGSVFEASGEAKIIHLRKEKNNLPGSSLLTLDGNMAIAQVHPAGCEDAGAAP